MCHFECDIKLKDICSVNDDTKDLLLHGWYYIEYGENLCFWHQSHLVVKSVCACVSLCAYVCDMLVYMCVWFVCLYMFVMWIVCVTYDI